MRAAAALKQVIPLRPGFDDRAVAIEDEDAVSQLGPRIRGLLTERSPRAVEGVRQFVGQLSTGGCLEPATLYLNVIETRGNPRHSH